MSKDININLSDLPNLMSGFAKKLNTYKMFLFFLAATSLYGYILWRVNTLSSIPADQSEETAQTTTQPHIDPETISKIQSLQDNSVSVQTLFDSARDNPFQE
jgi:hypothetical protein